MLNNAGQVCVAGSRLIVHRSIEAPLLDRIIALTKAIRPGPTWAAGTSYSPIISHPQMARIDGIVKRAIADGASALIGGGRLSTVEDGAYYQPTILSNVSSASESVREEIFGPVLTVQSFDDDEEGLQLTDHNYGLAAGVYTGDINRALRARRRIQAGTIWVNRYGRSADFIIPTGGFNNSGIGKDLGRQAQEANLRHKSTLIAFDE
jgi:aldehyde dehydrogenase (NAD+)